ncbi:peptidoglycan DD-metalloendopeptidase family protein [Streptomyces sp. KK5PA1]|uniref:Peptidoglycan DD-metalloendopeptidase family protein n=2 Tax=Actinacidiphila acididurans TaxID=2784346 RepID=A0ABS2TPQ8_9ACTN|nr:peptidoglycan DD-metalloendopeptidase family protein [Actinacidiphila acididurans]
MDGRCWPVTGAGPGGRPEVLRGFEPPAAPWAAGHRGVDLRAGPAAAVRAAVAGRVLFAGAVAGTPVVAIGLADGRRITYEPVRATVPAGTVVAAGQVVGTLGPAAGGVPAHCRAGPCLHWGLITPTGYADPLSLLPAALRRAGPVRLLPVYSAVSG